VLATLSGFNLPTKEFFVLKHSKGNELNAWMIKPTRFFDTSKYFMFQYSGPGSQQVMNAWASSNDY
jgi:dipeptidyl-peptidase-4